MNKKLIIASLVILSAGPAWARPGDPTSDVAGGVRGNGNSTGAWCYDSITLPAYLRVGPHNVPCWSNS
jgi:hypothetical protein